MSTTVIICATVSFIVAVTAFVLLTLQGIDTASLGAFLVMIIGNSIPTVASYLKTHQIDKKVDTVVEHTNGPLTETIERVKNIEDHITGGTS